LVGGGAVGLLVGALLMGTLGNGIVMFIECIFHLLASVWGMGILVVVCTLGQGTGRYPCAVVVASAICVVAMLSCIAGGAPWC
jgi:hypothetical protein